MSPSWSGRRPALDERHIPELIAVREAIRSIPSVPELAERWGVSAQTVRNYLRGRLPKRFLAHGWR
jgi:hypothetical protein